MSAPEFDLDEPTIAGTWSHCIDAGEDIEDIFYKLIYWHFDTRHQPLVEEWLGNRIAMHDAMKEFLGNDFPQ